MAFEINEIDKNLVEGIIFKLDRDTVGLPRDGAISVGDKGAGVIPFQFPPRITGDSKDNKWTDIHNTHAWEPVKMWEGSNARRITLQAIYVATGSTINGVSWTPANVALVTRAYKQYFYSQPGDRVFPAVELKMYEHVPQSAQGNAKFRMMNVNIKPGSEIIVVEGAIFPLRVEVDITLEQTTRIVKDDGEAKLEHGNLPDFPPQDWY